VFCRQGRRFAQERDRDASVAGQSGIVGKQRLAVGAAGDVVDAVAADALCGQDAARLVGARGGEFEVGVIAPARRRAVGVTGDGDTVGQLFDHVGDRHQQSARALVRPCVARIEHRAALLIDDLDAQAFGRLLHDDVARELGDVRHVLHRLADGDLGAAELGVLAQRAGPGERVFVGRLLAAFGLRLRGAVVGGVRGELRLRGGRHRRGVAVAHAFFGEARALEQSAGAGRHAADAGGREELGDAAALLRTRRVDEPHQQEERHHGGDEVGVGNLPGAAVMAAAGDFLHLLDQDRALIGRSSHCPSVLAERARPSPNSVKIALSEESLWIQNRTWHFVAP